MPSGSSFKSYRQWGWDRQGLTSCWRYVYVFLICLHAILFSFLEPLLDGGPNGEMWINSKPHWMWPAILRYPWGSSCQFSSPETQENWALDIRWEKLPWETYFCHWRQWLVNWCRASMLDPSSQFGNCLSSCGVQGRKNKELFVSPCGWPHI